MCVILGVSYDISSRPETPAPTDQAKAMLRSVADGGPDAFGLAWCTHDGVIRHVKCAGRADDPELTNQIDLPYDIQWFIGHVRDTRPALGGRGTATEPSNNHPIWHGSVIGVHSGSITNHRRILEKTGRTDDRAQVDSEAIFAAVHRLGVPAGLAQVNGTLAVALARATDPAVLFLARSWGPNLFLGRARGSGIAFASQRSALDAVQANLEITHVTDQYQLLYINGGQVTHQSQYRPISWLSRDGTNRVRELSWGTARQLIARRTNMGTKVRTVAR